MNYSIRSPLWQSILLTGLAILIGLGLNLVRSDRIPWLAKKLTTAESIIPERESPETFLVAITLDQAKSMYDQNMVFIDAREKEYYAQGHIQGAWENAFLFELVFNLEAKQGKETAFVIYCSDDGCGSSEELAYDLEAQGFTKIYVFKGGWYAWTEAGYPMEVSE